MANEPFREDPKGRWPQKSVGEGAGDLDPLLAPQPLSKALQATRYSDFEIYLLWRRILAQISFDWQGKTFSGATGKSPPRFRKGEALQKR